MTYLQRLSSLDVPTLCPLQNMSFDTTRKEPSLSPPPNRTSRQPTTHLEWSGSPYLPVHSYSNGQTQPDCPLASLGNHTGWRVSPQKLTHPEPTTRWGSRPSTRYILARYVLCVYLKTSLTEVAIRCCAVAPL